MRVTHVQAVKENMLRNLKATYKWFLFPSSQKAHCEVGGAG